jgi:hypothetical protein
MGKANSWITKSSSELKALQFTLLLKKANKRRQDNKLSDTKECDLTEIYDFHLSGKYECYKILQFSEKRT